MLQINTNNDKEHLHACKILSNHGSKDILINKITSRYISRQIDSKNHRQNSQSYQLCGNCSLIGHDLKRCIGPVNGFGVIDGCPMCNTKDHVLFECPKSWKSESNQRDVLIFWSKQQTHVIMAAELTAHSAWTSTRVELRPLIWTPSFALQYQLENPSYWRDYRYASKWEDDSVIAQDPAWENPSSPIRLIDRSERGLNMGASSFGRPSVSQHSPPLQQYYQTPAAAPAAIPDSHTVSAKLNKGKGKKNKYRQRSPLSAQDPSSESRMIFQGRMDAPDFLPALADNQNVRTKSGEASKNPAGDVVSDEELGGKSGVTVDDAALERKKAKRRRKQMRTRVKKGLISTPK
ncbi:hypothetical protein DID88_005951 [Monilinia fructigena]|uniref:Uncharacterized protein n=1 Tax=Monilinia fructigena TaxID=38457 RepID=A0A395J1B7_9HELO|nr:hypothetical protein DID88_005951 [Monilinia fructigena]